MYFNPIRGTAVFQKKTMILSKNTHEHRCIMKQWQNIASPGELYFLLHNMNSWGFISLYMGNRWQKNILLERGKRVKTLWFSAKGGASKPPDPGFHDSVTHKYHPFKHWRWTPMAPVVPHTNVVFDAYVGNRLRSWICL